MEKREIFNLFSLQDLFVKDITIRTNQPMKHKFKPRKHFFILLVLITFCAATSSHTLAKENQPISAQLQRAHTLISQGRIEDAKSALVSVKHWLDRHQNLTISVQWLVLLSDVHLLQRNLEEAYHYADMSLTFASKQKDQPVLAIALNQLGNVQMAMHQHESALQSFKKAIDLTKTFNQPTLAIKVSINAAHAALTLKQHELTTTLLTLSLNQSIKLDPSVENAMNLISIGHLFQQLINSEQQNLSSSVILESAYKAYQAALSIANASQNNAIKSYAYGHLAELYLAKEKISDAEKLFNLALFQSAQQSSPEIYSRWYWQLGRIKKLTNQPDQAIQYYRKSISALESIESALIYGYRGNPNIFTNRVRRIYLELAELLLNQANNSPVPQISQSILSQVKQVIEQYKTFELKNYYQDDCVTELQKKLTSQKIDHLLTPKTLTLYPIVFPNRLEILVGLPNQQTQHFEVSISASQLNKKITAFRQQLSHPGNSRRLKSTGYDLYKWLIKPFEELLQKFEIDTLVVIPDSMLHSIPFSALFDGQDFLINKYAFAITPGMSLNTHNTGSSKESHILLTGLTEAVQNYNSLPYVADEIQQIGSLFPKHTILLNEQFLKNRVKQQFSTSPYTTAVFSTHAQFSSNPKQSFLLTYQNKITLDELEQFIRNTNFHTQALDLLVLSACDTAQGDERAYLGLAGIAVKSGAQSVLASLWPVNDASTAQLIPKFFNHLKHQTGKAKALQKAQQALQSESRFQHPYYWAGFLLIGNWQ